MTCRSFDMPCWRRANCPRSPPATSRANMRDGHLARKKLPNQHPLHVFQTHRNNLAFCMHPLGNGYFRLGRPTPQCVETYVSKGFLANSYIEASPAHMKNVCFPPSRKLEFSRRRNASFCDCGMFWFCYDLGPSSAPPALFIDFDASQSGNRQAANQ